MWSPAVGSAEPGPPSSSAWPSGSGPAPRQLGGRWPWVPSLHTGPSSQPPRTWPRLFPARRSCIAGRNRGSPFWGELGLASVSGVGGTMLRLGGLSLWMPPSNASHSVPYFKCSRAATTSRGPPAWGFTYRPGVRLVTTASPRPHHHAQGQKLGSSDFRAQGPDHRTSLPDPGTQELQVFVVSSPKEGAHNHSFRNQPDSN